MICGLDAAGDAFSRLVQEIYEAASAPELWPRIMNGIAADIGAESTHLMVYDAARRTEILNRFEHGEPEAIRAYMRDYLPIDPRVPRRLHTDAGAVIADRDIWSAEERQNSPVYQDFQLKNGLHDITGAHMSMGGTLIWYGVAKGRPGVFSRRETMRLQAFMPHIAQSLRLHLHLRDIATQRDMLGQLWHDSGKAVLLVDARGRIRFSNRLAEELIRAGMMQQQEGALAFSDSRTNAALQRAIATMRNPTPPSADPASGTGALVVDARTGRQFGVRLMRQLSGPGEMDVPGEMILVTVTPLDLEHSFSELELQRFAALFDLTDAELRVVGALAAGEDVESFARARRIKGDTARKQLKAALAKTGSRGQKDLLRRIERFCFLRTR